MRRMQRPIIVSIIVGIIFISAVPMLINYMLRVPAPFDMPVVCDSSSWLSFWGAYLGGILTAILGFVTLYYNQKTTRDTICKQEEEKRKELQRLQARELERELIGRVESLSISSLNRIVSRLLNGLSALEAQNEIEDLKRRLEKVESQCVSWGLLYWPETMRSKPDGFEVVYLYYMERFRNIVNNAILLLHDVVLSKDALDLIKVKKLEEDVKQYNSTFAVAFAKPIRNWIKEEMQQVI